MARVPGVAPWRPGETITAERLNQLVHAALPVIMAGRGISIIRSEGRLVISVTADPSHYAPIVAWKADP